MKKLLFIIFYLCLQTALAQTNIAVPNYASVTNSFNASTGNIKFYLNGVSQTLNVGRGANGVCFYGSDMFVAIDDGIGTKGIIWYANVSFSSGSFTSAAPVLLSNSQGTFSVAADASGNIYSANNNGTVTKFIRNNIAPFYSAANVVNTIFWSNGGFAEASGVFADTATQTLWVVSYANNQGAVVKLSDFDYADGFGNNTKIKRFADNNLPITLLQKPEGIAKDASGNIWIANNNNNYVLRLNNSVVTTFISDLNAADYSFVTLNATQLNDFAVSPNGHQLGGLVYDNLYSSKMYVNDQQSGGNTFVYSFIANNATPTFSATSMTQIYPGAGQCAIIPCALLPTPSNPTSASANPSTVNSGNGSILLANGCAGDQTYLWKEGATVLTTNSTYDTPPLTTSATYTVYCVRGGTCQSNGTDITVTVNSNCNETEYVDGLVTPGPFAANQVIQASEYIIAGNGIDPLAIISSNSDNLTLRAGKSITINSGMMVGNGAVFKAEIGACENTPPAHTTFYMDGRNLKDPCGNTVILKGVNKMHVWTDQNGASIPQIAITGANTVRIVWTITWDHDGDAYLPNGNPNPNATPNIPTDDSKLDALIALCIQYKMIPMPEIHDATGNIAALPSVVNYWKRPEILAIINKYKHAMLLNIANEPGNENVTAQQYEDAYKLAITELRNAGITVPLVIDGAVEYAKDLTPIVQKATILTNHDPLHNLLFSVHPYWPMNNGATPAFITDQFESAVNANVPLILGELSKYGAWAGNGVSVCSSAGQVDYEWMASEAQRLGIGWLAWEWGPGNSGGGDPLCTAMDMTTNNTYATLTGWGLALATNATYGLITAQKTSYILSGFQNCN